MVNKLIDISKFNYILRFFFKKEIGNKFHNILVFQEKRLIIIQILQFRAQDIEKLSD